MRGACRLLHRAFFLQGLLGAFSLQGLLRAGLPLLLFLPDGGNLNGIQVPFGQLKLLWVPSRIST